MAAGANALLVLGQADRAKDWINRALLIDPDNLNMRYNLACGVSSYLKDAESAVELLGPFFAKATTYFLNHAKIDPDLDTIRGDPRFKEMIAAAEARLAAADEASKA